MKFGMFKFLTLLRQNNFNEKLLFSVSFPYCANDTSQRNTNTGINETTVI